MSLITFLLVMLIVVVLALRWIIIIGVTILGFVSGGFFAGIGMGLITWGTMKVIYWVSMSWVAYRAVRSEND